jgi:SAM-dependent methyltransferase
MLAELRVGRPRRVLDVGCSTAALATALEAAWPGANYFGCDISQTAVDTIDRPQVVQWDLNEGRLPFPDTTFDAVVASGICEYVTDLTGLFAGIAQRLDDDGRLIVSYVNNDHISRRWRRLCGRGSGGNSTWQPIRSLVEFSEILGRAGFVPIRRMATNGRIHAEIRPLRLIKSRQWQARQPWINWTSPQVVFVCKKDRRHA